MKLTESAKIITYTITLEELKKQLAVDLECSPEQITVEDVKRDISSQFDGYAIYVFDGLKITVKGK